MVYCIKLRLFTIIPTRSQNSFIHYIYNLNFSWCAPWLLNKLEHVTEIQAENLQNNAPSPSELIIFFVWFRYIFRKELQRYKKRQSSQMCIKFVGRYGQATGRVYQRYLSLLGWNISEVHEEIIAKYHNNIMSLKQGSFFMGRKFIIW